MGNKAAERALNLSRNGLKIAEGDKFLVHVSMCRVE